MASGYGYTGGRSRCFAYWQEFQKCYAQADTPKCLHHTKEIARAKAVKAEFIKQAEHHAKEGRKVADVLADGVIVGVGLIQRDRAADTKAK
ncbi:hypothetical protein BJ138DRAFT_1114367 [Hygrophoropsis aurantiaca]|uniref:Uncharacterized protein n=1 Tax=Hygrophoropsis aurantiaca TaxID=72124 RepID=A0ACB8ABL2_9AGAM|nr:hypothetical protein BJ138DRAFT_1114367 [Hygrophoropsis aurantiaca]